MASPTLPAHPDSAAEQTHLTQTLQIIEREIALLEKETGVGAEEERDVAASDDGVMDEQVMVNILRLRLDTLHRLARSRHQAYFARLDFIPQGGEKEIHYLGRWGVLRSDRPEVVVVDWRSPVANLYYSGQVGPMDYEAPDGRVKGELTLKRMLTVRDAQLTALFDSGVVSQDEYLQEVLGTVSSDRLREIVTTIQAEQNLIIRHPWNRSLIVQGAAGSGKTTIALHRIAYLLYACRDTLRAEQMMILAPNPLFLSYISNVLPDLGVERVHQTTFADLCARWMGKRAPRIRLMSRLESRLCGTDDPRDARVLARKGSLAYQAAVEAFLDDYQREIVPAEGLRFGGRELFGHEKLQSIFLRQLSPFPLALRIPEMRKYVRRQLDALCASMKQALEAMAQEKLNRLLAAMPDGPERQARARRLLDSRDARLAEIDEKQKQYLKDFPKRFPDLKPMALYRQFLLRCESEEVRQATLPYLDKGEARGEDLAALITITRRVWGLAGPNIRHVVMDECQDFSPYQLAVLRQAWPGAVFTLVGDLMQGIHAQEGTSDYAQWLEPVFEGGADLRFLEVSYRSTAEIMTLAGRIAACFPLPGLKPPRPVLRHGEPPALRAFPTDAARLAALAEQLRAWQAEGFQTIAVITKTRAEAAALHRTLRKTLPVTLPDAEDRSYAGGMLILPAAAVKGLEFDCVAIANASAEAFPATPFLCRVLYVLATRPLHRLALFSTGPMTEMAAAEPANP